MWVLVLAPPLLRSRSEGRPSTSIGSFRRQLATLSRTAPDPRSAMRSLNRSVVPMRAPTVHPGYDVPVHRAPMGYEPQMYQPDYDSQYAAGYGPPIARRPRPAPMTPMGYRVPSARASVRRRRQNVLFGLLVLAAVTALGGFGLGVSFLIGVHLLVDALLVFYVYLLVQLRRAEEERAMRYAW